MTIEPLEGIVNNSTLGQISTLTWETDADWDAAVSESGVVHESTADSDLSDATVVQLGYGLASPYLFNDMVGYWPLQEDSGDALDFSSNNHDGTVNGATQGATGLLNTSTYDFDGENDYVDLGQPAAFDLNTLTISLWARREGDITRAGLFSERYQQNTTNVAYAMTAGMGDAYQDIDFGWYDGSFTTVTAPQPALDTWEHYVGTYDGSDLRIYKNATQEAATSDFDGPPTPDEDIRIAQRHDDRPNSDEYEFFNGKLADIRLYNRALSASEVQTLYDVPTATGTLETDTKTFSSPTQPDLTDLAYDQAAAAESITVDVIGSPGTGSEETVNQTLDGASSYTLSWASDHQDFRVQLNLATTDVTQTPTVNRVSLQ